MEDKKKDLLIVVDMQNDFVTGTLGSPAAQKLVTPMTNFLSQWLGDIIFTQDTHYNEEYLDTQEGRNLPIKHCIFGTQGWDIVKELITAPRIGVCERIPKNTFGFIGWGTKHLDEKYNNIYICGVCTDICVVSNALILKAWYPEMPIYVIENLCAGVMPESHKAALETMISCQIGIKRV